MKESIRQPRICPLCGQTYTDAPALSRTDNETQICPDCGTRQALESIGVSTEEREKIISIIHQRRPKNTPASGANLCVHYGRETAHN